MSQIDNKGKAIAFIVVLFTIIGLIVQAAPANDLTGMFTNIFYGKEKWSQNPIILAILIAIIINFAGYVENTVINKQPYNINKWAETYTKYLPMLIVFTQYLPPEKAAAISVALDIITRAIKTLKPQTQT